MNEAYGSNLTSALENSDGLLVIGILFEVSNNFGVSATYKFLDRLSKKLFCIYNRTLAWQEDFPL